MLQFLRLKVSAFAQGDDAARCHFSVDDTTCMLHRLLRCCGSFELCKAIVELEKSSLALDSIFQFGKRISEVKCMSQPQLFVFFSKLTIICCISCSAGANGFVQHRNTRMYTMYLCTFKRAVASASLISCCRVSWNDRQGIHNFAAKLKSSRPRL